MRATVLTGLRQVELQERPDPVAKPGWVVVRVESMSLCGTDAQQYDGRIDTPFPRVPGHDFSAWSRRSARASTPPGRACASR